MRITRTQWFVFLNLSIISLTVWMRLTYPHFSFVNLTVSRTAAQNIAKTYLKTDLDIPADDYSAATVFSGRQAADRYLQKSIGFSKELDFFKTYGFELFFWKTRFFKENSVEEFCVTVSAATGEITGFSHTLKSTAARPDHGREEAQRTAAAFLKSRFGFQDTDYEIISNLAKIYDHRTDYTFEWARKSVSIPWNETPKESGQARLLTGVTVSGNDILSFTKQKLKIPEEFTRHIKRIQNTGKNFSTIFRLTFFLLLVSAIFYIINRRHSLILHILRKPVLTIALTLFIIKIAVYVDGLEYVLLDYPTTSSMTSYLWRFFSGQILDTFMITITFAMPFLAGELLHFEQFPDDRDKTLLHHLRSTFCSRNVASLIFLGYLGAIILLGLQSVLFQLGEHFFGVWTEYLWMTSFTASYIPAFPVLVLALSASLSEETLFRLFGINIGIRFLKNTALAVFLSSLIWGFGHTSYPIYPMWFRGFETTCLGIVLSIIYLRFGLIPVLVIHYLFDVFWGSAAFLLGASSPSLFFSSLLILCLPLILAVIFFAMNRAEVLSPIHWRLSGAQRFNLRILKYYLRDHPIPDGQTKNNYIKTIVDQGWDIAVVETAVNELKFPE